MFLAFLFIDNRMTVMYNEYMDIIKRKKFDIILIFVVAMVFIIGIVAYGVFQGKGKCVSVSVNGKVTATYSLAQDTKIKIKGIGGSNVLVIKNGKAKIQDADCPDKLCEKTGEIDKTGESIVCLPHKVIVSVIGDNKEVDAVAR